MYTTIWTGAYLRTTSGTSTATKTLKIVHNLAGSSLPPPKEFSASNYYSSRKFLFNYHCQKTDTETDKRESHRESERRGGGQGEGRKTSKNIGIHTLRHFFSSFRFFLPETERGPVFTDTLREGGADLRRRFSDRLALLSFWMLRKGRLNLFIFPSSSCRSCFSCCCCSSSFSSPPSVPTTNFSNFEFREQIANVFLRTSARFLDFFFLRRMQRPKPNG